MIYIDPATGSKELFPLFPCGRAVLTNLNADFGFFGNGESGKILIGIERKSIITGDFFNSFTSGRLIGQQLPKMKDTFQVVYLLIEGRYRNIDGTLEVYIKRRWQRIPLKNSFWRYDQFLGILESLRNFTGIRLLFSENEFDSVNQILSMEKFWSKPFNDHQAYKAIYTGQKGLANFTTPFGMQLLCLFPGIKFKTAKLIYDKFCPNGKAENLLAELLNFKEFRWRSIKGIGAQKVSKIKEFIKKEVKC